jgi:hypothetical protein
LWLCAIWTLAGCGRIGFDEKPTSDASHDSNLSDVRGGDAVRDAFLNIDAVLPACGGGDAEQFDATTGSCFVGFKDPFTWAEAENRCRAFISGAHLASIADSQQTAAIKALAVNLAAGSYWIGANDIAAEGIFTWNDGLVLSYTNWRTNEPNNQGGNQNCVSVNNTQWFDNNCSDSLSYICKFRSRP